MQGAYLQGVKEELRLIAHSFYRLSLLIFLPLGAFALIVIIFKAGVLESLPIAIVDSDHSKSSRELIHKLNSTKTLQVAYRLESPKEAIELLKNAKVYGVIIIPYRFEKELYTLMQPHLSVMINTQFILVGKIIQSSLLDTLRDAHAPIKLQVRPFFNLYQNYFLFLVSAILPALWQIFIAIMTVVSFGEVIKQKREKALFKEAIVLPIIAKLTPYTLYFTLLGIGYIFFIYGVMSWPFEGSMALMIFSIFITVIAYEMIALFFLVLTFDYARTLSLVAAYTAPAFAFLGVTFPTHSMGDLALFWRNMLPISHYMMLQISQANYGGFRGDDLYNILAIGAFWLLIIPIFIRLKLRLHT